MIPVDRYWKTAQGLVLMALLTFAGSLFAQAPNAGITDRSRWHEPFVTLLDVDFVGTGFHARWEYFHCGCGDILVRLEQSAPDGVVTGELLIIDGQVLAARGMVGMSSDLEPMLQAPSMMLHLAFALLERGIPKGPVAVEERQSFSVKEPRTPLDLNSGMVTGSFPAPWAVSGDAWSSGPGQRRFEMQFEFDNPTEEVPGGVSRFNFSGGQDFRRDDFPLPDATVLDGWRVQWISKGEEAAVEAPAGLTLGELRADALALGAPES